MSLAFKILGVRGSRPTHKLSLLNHGGNSTAMEFMTEEPFHLFLDGGSGLVPRGRELTSTPDKKHFHFLITHTHWDHILGLPFFEPLYNKDNTFTFYSSMTTRATFYDLFFGQTKSLHLPIPTQQFKAKIKFETITPGDSFQIGSKTTIRTYQLNHQGVTLGYRVEHEGKSICVITDNAPIEGANYMGENMNAKTDEERKAFENNFNLGLIRFLQQADTVVFDTHFTEANLKADWGHSTPPRALEFCKKAGAKRLILFHHAPEDIDKDVEDKVASVLNEAKQAGIEVVAAREDKVWIHR